MSKIATRFLALFLTLAMLLPNLLPVSAAEMTGQSAAVQSSEGTNTETPSKGTPGGKTEETPAGAAEGASEGTSSGKSEGSSEGTPAGSSEGSSEGTPAGSSEGSSEGTPAGSSEGSSEGTPAGSSEGSSEGTPAGSSGGSSEGTPAGSSEGSSEGTPTGSSEGSSEGTPGEDDEKDSEDDSNENPVTHSEITSLTFGAAPETEQPVDGLIAVASGTDTASTYFTVKSATAIRVGERLYATLTVDTAYTYLYFGAKSTLDALLAAGEPVSALASPFHFTSSAGDNSRLTVCAVKADEASETGYAVLELELVIPQIPVPEAKITPVPTPNSYPAAPSAEQDMSGKLFVAKQGADAVYPMFKIESATAVKDDKQIYVTVQVNAAASGTFTYSYLYFGTRTALAEQLTKDGPFDVVGGVNGEKQSYHFTLPLSAEGTRVPVCVLKSDLTAKSPYNSSELELVIPSNIPTAKITPVPTPNSYPAAPSAEQDMSGKLFVAKQGADAVYPMFKIESATAVKDDKQIYVTVQVNAAASGTFTYSYLYFGTRTALAEQLTKDGPFDVVGGVNGEKQSYHFTLPLSAEGTRVPVCVLKNDLTAKSPYNSSELELVIPSGIPSTGTAQPVPVPPIPALPENLSEANIQVVKASDGSVFKMFAPAKTGMVVGDTLKIHYETANVSYDKLYFGSKDDSFKSPYVQGVQKDGKWVFEFELPLSARGTTTAVCLGKPDGSWYTKQDLALSIPADTGDTGTTKDNADITLLPAGSWNQPVFAISSSSATLAGNVIYCTVTGKTSGAYVDKVADKLYLGSRDDKSKTPYITGIQKEDGTTTFSFSVPADKQGTSIPAVVGFTDGSWYTNLDLFLNIPNFDRSFDESFYTDGVYDIYGNAYAYLDRYDNRGLPVDTQSTLTVSGDTITIKWVTRASDTDKIYIGLVTDPMATREANAIGNADYAPIGLNYKVFYITLPKSWLGKNIPFVRHSPLWFQDTGGWLEKQDYLVLADYLPKAPTEDSGTVVDDAKMKMIAGGSEVEQSFVIQSSTAALKGDTITCTVTGNPSNRLKGKSSYSLYLGNRDDKDKSSSIPGTINEDGTVTFRFTVSADKQGVCIPAVLGYDSSWDTTQDYFLNIPNFDRKFSMDYYTDGEYDLFGNAYSEQQRTANRSFPVDSQSTLTVSGDKIILKWVCRSKTYDKLYFGTLADGEDAWNAGAISNADYAPVGLGYKVFYITLPKSALGTRIPFLRHNSKGWVKTQDYLILTDYLPRLSGTPVDPGPEPTPGEGIADGTYNTTGETGVNMFKVVKAVLTAKDGKYQVTLTLSGTGYDYLCVGSAADAPNKKDSWVPAKIVNCTINGETRDFYTYTFDVDDPTKPIAIASHSQKNDKWYDRTVTLNTTDLKRTAPDGSYTVTAECSASMFKIVSAKLVSVNGEMKAVLTLSGTGYDYLYPGTGEQAAKDKDNRVPFQTDADGKYTYTIPVSELDKPLTISSHSKKNDIWYDRVVTFLSSSLTKTGEVVTPDPGKDPTKPTDPETPTDPKNPDDESQHESDTSGSTTKVNNGTTLKDGVYTPDKFSFSGGSGRARIVCDKVTVKNGKAFATIRFVSASGSPTAYSYVKASGNKYYSTGVSTFTIPVALNQNNRILGMTTKMSAAHEIEYTIYIQLKEATATPNGTAAANDTDTPDPDSKLDKEAPDIMGLTYQETVKTPKSRYLRMFRYDQGVTLVEIDLTRDTVLDTDEARAAIAKADKEAQTDSTADIAVSDEPADTAQIASDYTAALYRADVLKYLLVPEKADLPAGLEKEYLIIRLPVSNIYLTGEEAVGTLYDLGGMDLVKLIGSEEPEYDLLEEALLEKQAAYGGGWDDPDYRAMVKAGIDFCLNDAGVLPLNEETRKERKLDAPEGETLTAVEYRDRLANVTDRFAVLGIPMLFDRSANEPEKEGQAAWIKLYGILLGQETKADKLYTSTVEG